jgi:hypothetical protein
MSNNRPEGFNPFAVVVLDFSRRVSTSNMYFGFRSLAKSCVEAVAKVFL